MTAAQLPDLWIAKIFDRLLGVYGNQFLSKFSRIEDGVDVGLIGAKKVWAEELAGFADLPGCISYALGNLPQDFPPNALQFVELCRKGPRPGMKALTYSGPPANPEKVKEFTAKLQEILRSANRGSDPIFWATHPKSQLALDFINDAAKNDPARFRPCVDHLIAEGKVSPDGRKLLVRYEGLGLWSKA